MPDYQNNKVSVVSLEPEPQYYVFHVGGGAPTKPHGSRYKARMEAIRLGKKHPHETFVVCKVKETVVGTGPLGIGDKVLINKAGDAFQGKVGEITFIQRNTCDVEVEGGLMAPYHVKHLVPVRELPARTHEVADASSLSEEDAIGARGQPMVSPIEPVGDPVSVEECGLCRE